MGSPSRFTRKNLEMLLVTAHQSHPENLYGFYRFNGAQHLTTTAVAGISGIIELDRAAANFYFSLPLFFYGTQEELRTNRFVQQPSTLYDFSDKITRAKQRYYCVSLQRLQLSQPRQEMIDSIHQELLEKFPSYIPHFFLIQHLSTDASPTSRAHRSFLRFPDRFREAAQRQGALYQYVAEIKTIRAPSPMFLSLPERPSQRSQTSLGYFPFLHYPQEINFFLQPSQT